MLNCVSSVHPLSARASGARVAAASARIHRALAHTRAALLAIAVAASVAACGDATAKSAASPGASAANAAATGKPATPDTAAGSGAAGNGAAGSGAAGSGTAGAPAPSGGAATDRSADVEALIRAFTPASKDVTSDVTDQWIRARKAALNAHVSPDPSLGQACWTAYRERADLAFDVRRDLLEVAARTDPTPMRERLAAEFDAYGAEIGLRSRAIELLAELDAPRALALLEPLVVEARKQRTYPPQETLLHAWNEAAKRVGIDRTAVLARVGADLMQDDPARHLAVRQLGTCDGAAAALALEAVLVESTGNGYLRRIAAQSLAGNKKFTTACATLKRVLERESDENFALFLDDLIAKNCR